MSIKESLLNTDTWLRGGFILLFWILLTLVGWVLGAVIVVQFVIVLCSGQANRQLLDFAENLGTYLKQIVWFTCFINKEKPFPFSDFPSGHHTG